VDESRQYTFQDGNICNQLIFVTNQFEHLDCFDPDCPAAQALKQAGYSVLSLRYDSGGNGTNYRNICYLPEDPDHFVREIPSSLRTVKAAMQKYNHDRTAKGAYDALATRMLAIAETLVKDPFVFDPPTRTFR
jgi:hypothetical protein